ncbi:alcohol dehydrogenase [Companilactobacillus kimchiensis]|uniref:Alcohol dehydrogenase n=2 Tax=Companilactobacillus kimchiensis TaxID=993692 RepID=A0A0R2LGT2_9LACO|nr:zinc-binding dehydrogenase [Companilactobacillus kimchiensis]KRO00737.1 alcohol dehydrogenase [Companilactobacillus kimchiensis]
MIDSIGLNPVDYKLIESPLDSFEYPHTFGLDAAGTVVSVGENVEDFKVGDHVSGHDNLANNGTFAEYAIFPDYCLAKIPDKVSFETASALLCGAMTAYQAIFRKMNLTGKKTILIHAGAGGVESIAIQLAKSVGLKVITTVSTAKMDFVKDFEPDKIIDYRKENVTDEVMKYTKGTGVDLVLNTVNAHEAQLDIEKRLAYNGQLIWIAAAPESVNQDVLAEKGITISALNLGGAHQDNNYAQKKDLGVMATELLELVEQDKLDPSITEVLSFDQLVSGLEKLTHRDSVGKIIVKVTK